MLRIKIILIYPGLLLLVGGFLLGQVPMEFMDPGMMMWDPAMRPDARRAVQEMITCPECGTQSPVGTQFCPTCAFDLRGISPVVDTDIDVVEEVEVPKITVIEGDLIICRVTGKVLEEPVKKRVPLTDRALYEELGDDIYGNVTIIDDKYISAEANIYRRRIVDLVDQAMQMDAIQFSGELAAAITERSALENLYDLELDQVNILSEFRHKELQVFRVDPEDPFSEFHPVYLPRMPLFPPEEELERLERAVPVHQPGMPGMYMDPAMGYEPRGAGYIGLDRARQLQDQRR